MPPEFYITCPKCGHRYNVHKMIYDEGEDFFMFCPAVHHEISEKRRANRQRQFRCEKIGENDLKPADFEYHRPRNIEEALVLTPGVRR